MRVFAALPAPVELVAALDAALARVRIPGRLVKRQQWHVTLAFAADWRSPSGDPDDPTELIAACEAIDRTVGPVRLTRPGAFPSERAARVVWVGFDPAPLADLASSLAAVLAPQDRRPFGAHLTLARLRPPAPVGETVEALAQALTPREVHFEEVVLYRSRLGAGGARHDPLWRGPLE